MASGYTNALTKKEVTMRETFFNNLWMLDNQKTDEQIGFIDYMKELGFIDKDRLVTELGVVWEYEGDEIHVDHIYDNSLVGGGINQGEVFVDFTGEVGTDEYTEDHDDLYTSILMCCEQGFEPSYI
tara:strand:- start:3175 stop:3552 length:378 start_codon:yes stop_codon:yes gene_type:complete